MKERGISDEDVNESDFLWKKIDKKELENFVLFKSLDFKRVFILNTEIKGDVIDCRNTRSYFFEDCSKITEQPLMTSLTCSPLISNKIQEIRREKGARPFKFNLLQNQTHAENEPLYPFCKEKESFNQENVRKSVETWWKLISKVNDNPIWFHSYSQEPFLDVKNPYIELNLNYFAGRKNFQNRTYKIFSHTKLLHTGKMYDGKILANVTTFSVDDWIGPVKIVVGKFKTNVTLGVDAVELKKHIIVFGQLHKSKLQGLVRIMGILPNDPKDDCDQHTSSEFGFLGQYKNGIPSGYCWKRLIGGSWIHGKVDSNGDFSGDDISYINQDVETSFKGTFKNGVMIKAKHVEVIGERCNDEGIKIIEFSDPSSLSQEYHFERPTAATFGDQPLVVDPLDEKYIRLGGSNFDTGENSQGTEQNGAFANRDIPPSTMLAHNNGYILQKREMDKLKLEQEEFVQKKVQFYKEIEQDETVRNDTITLLRENMWKYRTTMKCGMVLDIPLEDGQDSSKYRSTKGHKINHSFAHSNAYLVFYDSARFGIVSSIMSRPGVTIANCSELFINYGYTYAHGPKWYKKLFMDFLFKEEAPRASKNGNLKDCHYEDGTPMDSEKCENYLLSVKNQYLRKHGITEDKKVKNEEIFNMILKSHQNVAQLPMKKYFSDNVLHTP